ncbi:MAG: DedA family protein [Dissulfurimicrobium sp.]|uniref:DedA family protein n=1 Tax=Dissulfurimicrobium TaxID=1769732 RepID=UPI001EDBF64B|nr:DedA family protein [Dissulfurimicrobium hydrothermale]UKL13218.1 DedA family protein [Dissulfurimicrobium hydrothermale]
MEILDSAIQLLLHLDNYLDLFVRGYGPFIYLILFLIVFAETGLVIAPFLPGDSLLFVTGTLAASGAMDIRLLMVLLIISAVLGDTVNYWAGYCVGPMVFRMESSRLLNKKHLERTHLFYEKYGGKTIIIARFIPIIRTFAPFVAGIGRMTYRRFVAYNIIGGSLWVTLFLLGGFFFGNISFVKKNLTSFIFFIIIFSIMPGVIEYTRARYGKARA